MYIQQYIRSTTTKSHEVVGGTLSQNCLGILPH